MDPLCTLMKNRWKSMIFSRKILFQERYQEVTTDSEESFGGILSIWIGQKHPEFGLRKRQI